MTLLETINNALSKQQNPWIYLRRDHAEAIKAELESKAIHEIEVR